MAVVRSEKLVNEATDSLETQRKERAFAVEATNKQRLLRTWKTEKNSPVMLMITLANTCCDDYVGRMVISQVSGLFMTISVTRLRSVEWWDD